MWKLVVAQFCFGAILLSGSMLAAQESDTDTVASEAGTDTAAESVTEPPSAISPPVGGPADDGSAAASTATGVNANEMSQPDASPKQDEQEKKEADKKGSGKSFWKKLDSDSKRDISARLFANYQLTDKTDTPHHFELDVARLNLSWSYRKVLQVAFEYDFANLVEGDEVRDGLRDAFIRIEPTRWFGFQMGQFKKPFSKLELTSRKKLASVSRGEGNRHVMGVLQYGGRDLGAMISGRLVKSIRLEYAAGVFNGGEAELDDLGTGSLDYVFRLSSQPVKWLTVGGGASARVVKKGDLSEFFDLSDYNIYGSADYPDWMNWFEPEQTEEQFQEAYQWLSGTHWMGELDVSLKFGNFTASNELMLGDNWWFENTPYLWTVTSLLSYQWPVKKDRLIIEPVLFFEMMHIEDADWTWKVRLLQLSPGINVHLGKDLRLMVHGEFITTTGLESDIAESSYSGAWPGEWPGRFEGSKTLFVQLGFAN